ncbi:hypothetical protein GCM10023259_072780 [Thermocatellispora tengchongensis]
MVMPVRDPGDAADAGIRAVLEQSLPPDEYEVIFADHGSTDGTAERLDTVAAGRDNVRVLHLDPSGSPMRARNVGLAVATGEYVYLLDQGDRLERDALARMYERAAATEADVLVGRIVREQGSPPAAFDINRDRADILKDRLLTQLTPHKLFRRAFLEDLGLRFAEPGGVLAEYAFVLRAYLSAKVIAILADRVCCHVAPPRRRPERPAAMAAELRALLDVVDQHTVPGKLRDRVYAHWLRTAVLRPFTSPRFLASSQDRAALFRTLRDLTLDRFPPRLDHYLPVHLRAVAALLRAGRLDQLFILTGMSRGTRVRAELHEVRWDHDVLTIDLTAEIVRSDGVPLRFGTDHEGRLYWRPPMPIEDTVLPPELADVSDAVARARLGAYIRHEQTGVTYVLPTTSEVELLRDGAGGVRVRLGGEVRLDAGTAAVGHPLQPGLWELHVRAYGGAYRARARVAGAEAPLNCVGVVTEHPRRLVVPYWSDEGELGVCVEPRSFPESIALVSPGASVTRRDGHLYIVVPVPYVPPSGGPPVELVLREGHQEIVVPGLVEPGVPGKLAGQLVAKVPLRRLGVDHSLGPGTWTPYLRADGRETGLRFALDVRRNRRVDLRRAVAMEAPPPGRRGGRPRRRIPLLGPLWRFLGAGRSRYDL